MKPEAKMILLERKFLSIGYIRHYVDLYEQFVDSVELGMSEFFYLQKQNPNINADNIDSWVEKGLPILKGNVAYAKDALIKAEHGDISYAVSSAGDLKGLSKDVDNIGGFGAWWKELDQKYESNFRTKRNLAMAVGCNIYYTERDFWDDDEILDEEITGPINEAELLNYLKPGESLDDLG